MGIEESHILKGAQALGSVRQRVLWKVPGEMPGGAVFWTRAVRYKILIAIRKTSVDSITVILHFKLHV